MNFEIAGEITVVGTIAAGTGIRDIKRLRKNYGKGRWRKMKGVARARLENGRVRLAELHWYEAHGIGKRRSNANATWTDIMKKKQAVSPHFAVCMKNTGYPSSLELHKIYRVIPDEDAAEDGDIRVVDESGEDYLYPAKWFAELKLPQEVQKSLLHVA